MALSKERINELKRQAKDTEDALAELIDARCVTNLSANHFDNLVRDAMKWRNMAHDQTSPTYEEVCKILDLLRHANMISKPTIQEVSVVIETLVCERQKITKLWAVAEAASNVSNTLNGGKCVCSRCGNENDTTDFDFADDLRAALFRLDQKAE